MRHLAQGRTLQMVEPASHPVLPTLDFTPPPLGNTLIFTTPQGKLLREPLRK